MYSRSITYYAEKSQDRKVVWKEKKEIEITTQQNPFRLRKVIKACFGYIIFLSYSLPYDVL